MRILGYQEATCQAYHRHFRCSGMILQFARVYGPLDADLARSALRWVQRRHPLLQAEFVAIDDEHDGFSFAGYVGLGEGERLAAVPLRVSPRAGEGAWKVAVEEELATDFDPAARYLWRLHILAGEGVHDCIFVVHHAIGDGMSCAILVRDFLVYCAELRSSGGRPPSYSPLPLLPAVEAMIPAASAEAPVLGDLVREGSIVESEVRPWSFEERAPLARRTTRAFYHTIEAGWLERLRGRSRERGVTLGSLLTAALMTSDGPRLGRGDAGAAVCATAISLRDECRPAVGRDHFGCYVMVVNTQHPLGVGSGLWELARDCQRGLRAELDRRRRIGFMPSRYQKGPLTEGMVDALTRSNQLGVYSSGPGISNIGVLDIGRTFGDFMLGEMHFCTAQNAGSCNVAASVSTHQGRLQLCFTYTAGLHSASGATMAFERTIEAIQSACG